jgi:hypothetical protein
MKLKTYLGDGVYVEWRDNDVKLTTSNGVVDTNTVILEPEVLEALLLWVEVSH